MTHLRAHMHIFQDVRADDQGVNVRARIRAWLRDSSQLRIDELRNLGSDVFSQRTRGMLKLRYKRSTFNDATVSPPRMSAQVPRISVLYEWL